MFLGTPIAHLIGTFFWSLDRCSTLFCLSPKSLHTSWILVGLQHPSENDLYLSILWKLCWKCLMWAWYCSWWPWSIQHICLVAKYCWCSRFDETIHNGFNLFTTSLIHCCGQLCFRVIHDQGIYGGKGFPKISLIYPGRNNLVPDSPLALPILFYVGTLILSVVLEVRSWKPYNIEPLPFLFSAS